MIHRYIDNASLYIAMLCSLLVAEHFQFRLWVSSIPAPAPRDPDTLHSEHKANAKSKLCGLGSHR